MSWLEDFHKNGYVVIEDVYSAEELNEMKTEINRLITEIDFDEHPRSIFSTHDENRHIADEYFLNSSDKIRVFFEEGAHDANGNLIVDKHHALNKIGHGLHLCSPVFKRMSFHDKLKQLLKHLEYIEPKIVQSMYIFKQPKIGGVVMEHVDASFLYVEPFENLIGIWIAIDDADEKNGCLAFIPGSHKRSSVEYRFLRTHETNGSPLLKFVGIRPTYDRSLFISVPVKKGSVVIIHSLVVHRSDKNSSSYSRHAYTLHIMDGKNTTWSRDNWFVDERYKNHPRIDFQTFTITEFRKH
ncbi:Phytanoyl-CoA dioxygenase [Dictyocaulus viviparus]|uniref:Phytanoyl-CoA dioxygenase n=1 Tax=Dictyocaulus viviparus TaxID=29172 RepID=A0A0D8XLG6_DICVI|nr:Phytanoyl-CoA dioxygenase [Dictyocaulus viviparus]